MPPRPLVATVAAVALTLSVACQSPTPPPAATVDTNAGAANVPTADSLDAVVNEVPAPDADPDVAAATDAAHDAPGVQDAKKYPDCTLPQTENCPCTAAELGKMCCLKITDGLVCNKRYFDGVLVWQHVSDCCRDPDPGCNNPKPTPPWCNGKYPY